MFPAFLLIAALPAAAAQYGVCFHHHEEYAPSSAKVLDDLRKAGPFWVRGDMLQPPRDAKFAADMAKKGINVLALLPWYSTNTANWTAYVSSQAAATPNVPAWEIANEPEMTWWGGPIPAEEYMRMLKSAHAVLRKTSPKAKIVGPAIGANAEGLKYLEKLIALGFLDYVDAVSFHYYIFHKNLDFEGVKTLVAGRKPLWITETGWTTADQEGGEEAQLAYIGKHYGPKGSLSSDPAVEVLFHYELNDDRHPVPAGKDDGWGLTRGARGKFGGKKAYEAFKRLL